MGRKQLIGHQGLRLRISRQTASRQSRVGVVADGVVTLWRCSVWTMRYIS